MAAAAAAARRRQRLAPCIAACHAGKTEKSSPRAVFAFAWPQAIGNCRKPDMGGCHPRDPLPLRATHERSPSSAQRSQISQLAAARLQRFRVPLLARDRPALGSRREQAARSAPEKRDTVGGHVHSPPLRGGDRPSCRFCRSTARSTGRRALAVTLMTIATLLNALAGPVERGLVMTGFVQARDGDERRLDHSHRGRGRCADARYGLTGAAVSVLLHTIVRNVAKTYLLYRRCT